LGLWQATVKKENKASNQWSKMALINIAIVAMHECSDMTAIA